MEESSSKVLWVMVGLAIVMVLGVFCLPPTFRDVLKADVGDRLAEIIYNLSNH